jgi:leucyl-tRNA synthetase
MLEGGRVWEQPWPVADEDLLAADVITLVVQVNGKLRDRIEVPLDADEAEVLAAARGSEKVAAHVEDLEVVKEIVVPGKLVNLVVR